MSTTFFIQECPTCGRNLQIRLELLGRSISCPQCEARIEASDSTLTSPHDSAELLLDPGTYEERSTASTRSPGALVGAMRFVL